MESSKKRFSLQNLKASLFGSEESDASPSKSTPAVDIPKSAELTVSKKSSLASFFGRRSGKNSDEEEELKPVLTTDSSNLNTNEHKSTLKRVLTTAPFLSWLRSGSNNVNPMLHLATFSMEAEAKEHDVTNSTIHDVLPNADRRGANIWDPREDDDNSSIGSSDSGDVKISEALEPEQSLTIEEKLQIVFELTDLDEYKKEFACWLVRSVLLKGYMYVTNRHVCFYSALPSVPGSIRKEGFLQKRSFKRPRSVYYTYWFVLKTEGLYIYSDKKELYFPKSTILLKNVIDVTSDGDKQTIKLNTTSKRYSFKADTVTQMNEWLQAINSAVFKAKVAGSDVRVVLPLDSITSIGIVQTEFSTNSLRLVVTCEESLVSEEYVFSYFNDVELASKVLQESCRLIKGKLIQAESTQSAPVNERPPRLDYPSRSSFHEAERTSDDSEEVKRKSWWKNEALEQEDFKAIFAIPETERLLASFSAYIIRMLPLSGKLYVSSNYLCFKSSRVGFRVRAVISIADIKLVESRTGLVYYSLVIQTKDQEEIIFDFHSKESRQKCIEALVRERAPVSRPVSSLLTDLRHVDEHQKSTFSEAELTTFPLVDTQIATPSPMHVTCLTIGTRGDVQPYIALCLGLMKDGHTCRIGTHIEYKEWIESFGIEFRAVKGDPAVLMQLCVDYGMFTVGFIRESLRHFRGWLNELLSSCTLAAEGTDLLIESPTAFGGLHISEAMKIPFFSAFPMPWTRTKAYPHPFAVAERHMGGSYNYMTYVMIEQVIWKGISISVNPWRKTMGLNPLSLTLKDYKTPFLYSFSPAVVPAPSDWPDWIHECGYWFLDNPDLSWTAPDSLREFIAKGPPPVYIGFGSIIVQDPAEGVIKSGVRAVVSKGWSSRSKDAKDGLKVDEAKEEHEQIYMLESVPHDWLFPQMAAVVHHGGAGTTAAGLRAGIPTLIHAFFGDQFFWAERIQDLGVGLSLRKLTINALSQALVQLTTDADMKEKASAVGVKIRAENGVATAISCIYRDLDYAKSRILDIAEKHRMIL